MNDDLVVSKILKLLENNTAFIGYALNGGVGTKINVRNTETGKTIQALSINVDSSGEVLVVKDSEDNQYKAVTFKTAEKVTERIIQLRKTKPVDDKKVIEYTDSDIEVFYLFVKLIDTGSPVTTQLTSTWIRKGSSCTQFVGAYERCNYGSKANIGGTNYSGLPYIEHPTLQACLDDDAGRDARTPHGTSDEIGGNPGWRIYSTRMTASQEQELLAALTSHDNAIGTNYRKLFGYGSILECSGAMYVQGWQVSTLSTTGENFFACDFSFLPGFTTECSTSLRNKGYCDNRGFINSKTPLSGVNSDVGSIDNSWGHEYGWVDLPYDFMYKRHFFPLYLNGSHAKGSFLILEGLSEDQQPTIPPGFFPWVPGCPSNGQGGPYDGSGGNRFPDGPPKPQKRDMKLSTHKAEIWLGSSKKEEGIKLYELGLSDLFSGAYNGLIVKADETRVDSYTRANLESSITEDDRFQHIKFYENWNKNIIDLRLDPRQWVYIIDNEAFTADRTTARNYEDAENYSIQGLIFHLYNRTINLTIKSDREQIVHLKLGLKPANVLTNTDCKGTNSGIEPGNPSTCSQSWEYQKYVTIKIKDWSIVSTINQLNVTDIENNWNKDYISRKFITSFGGHNFRRHRNSASKLLLRHDASVDVNELLKGDHYEQFNYSVQNIKNSYSEIQPHRNPSFYLDYVNIASGNAYRHVGLGTFSWWELWDRTIYDKEKKRLSSVIGFEKNYYQILLSAGLSTSLKIGHSNSGGFGLDYNAFSHYFPDRPLKYIAPIMRLVRNKTIKNTYYDYLKTKETILSSTGLLFYFADYNSLWSTDGVFAFGVDDVEFIAPPYKNYNVSSSPLYYTDGTIGKGLLQHTTDGFNYGRQHGGRFDTYLWNYKLWSQLVYDGFIKVDVDSYKKVDFNFYTPTDKYIKYASANYYANSEYSFVEMPEELTTLKTVLSPGTLDVTKQVKITKPTNVDLDPNMSFLVYLFPFVEVTKKKKTI